MRGIDNENISSGNGELIGGNVKEGVMWFKNGSNSGVVSGYKNKVKKI